MPITFTLAAPGRVVASGESDAQFDALVADEPFMLAMSDGTLLEVDDRIQIVIAGLAQPTIEPDGAVKLHSYIAWVAVADPRFVRAKAVASPDVFTVEDEMFLAGIEAMEDGR